MAELDADVETLVRDDRSVVDVLNDIFGNLQDLVRSEIRLAKAEVSDELRGATSSALGLGIAFLASAFTALFLLLSGMYALSLVMTTMGCRVVRGARDGCLQCRSIPDSRATHSGAPQHRAENCGVY